MFCTNCGSKLLPNSKFCSSCGTGVGGSLTSDNASDSNDSESQSPKVTLGQLLGGYGSDFFHLREFINIETATMGISPTPFTPLCPKCEPESSFSFDCSYCEIKQENFIQVPTGSGDGIYPVYHNPDGLGLAVYFDYMSAISKKHKNWMFEDGPSVGLDITPHITELYEQEVFQLATLSFPKDYEKFVADGVTLGTDEGKFVSVADANASNEFAFGGCEIQGDKVRVLVVLGENRPDELGELVPVLVLVLEERHLKLALDRLGVSVRELPEHMAESWQNFTVLGNLQTGGAATACYQTIIESIEWANNLTQDLPTMTEVGGRQVAAIVLSDLSAKAVSRLARLISIDTNIAQQYIQELASEFIYEDDRYSDSNQDTAVAGVFGKFSSIARGCLEAEGIPASLFDAQLTRAVWMNSVAGTAL